MASLGGGLTQRRGQHVRTDETTSNDQVEDLSGYPEDEEERDSKETRLTLMEEILLLGLKDREVKITLYTIYESERVQHTVLCLVAYNYL